MRQVGGFYPGPMSALEILALTIPRRLQDFLWEVCDTINLHPLTHPTFVSTFFSIGHEFSLNKLVSNRKKEEEYPLGNVEG